MPTSPRRPRIGLLFDSFWNDFEGMLWRGVVDEARAQDVDLLCFAGGSLRSPYSNHANRVVIHELVGKENVDGLLAISGCIGAFLDHKDLRDYLRRFEGLPLISVSTAFDDLPCTLVDNTLGMRELVAHFITQHGRRRIAFVNGPETTFDARERFAAYRQALADYNVPFDPNLVVPGDFAHASGTQAAITLVKERKAKFDTLIAANDNMALYAMVALRELGVAVPEDVLVGGFDDAKEARGADPSLTTVRQPTYELGRRSVLELVHWLRSGVPAKTVVLPTRVVARASCGCLHAGTSPAAHHSPTHINPLGDSVSEIAGKLGQRFVVVSDILGRDSWAEDLAKSCFAEHRGESGALVAAVEAIIRECGDKPVEPATWGEVLHYLFGLLDPQLRDIGNARDSAVLFVNQHMSRRQAASWVDYETQTQTLQRYQQPISVEFGLPQLGAVIAETLPRLGIPRLWISLYEDSGRNVRGDACPLITFARLSVDSQELRVYDATEAPRFKASALTPDNLHNDARALQALVFPLFFEQEQFGIAVFEIGTTTANIYESLCSHFISLIRGFRLLEETRNYTAKLEADVDARTAELQSKNAEIEKLNAELVEKNKVDVLTNLYNRGALFEFIKKELNRTRRNRLRDEGKLDRRAPGDHQTFSVMMCDLDHFKHINDTYGHLAGDQVLKTVGELFKNTRIIRQEDVAGRFGGEEFVVVLTNTDAENAVYPAKRFADALREVQFRSESGESFSVTVSIGISQYHDRNGNEEAVVARADKALYYAKNNGRDQIVVYEQMSRDD